MLVLLSTARKIKSAIILCCSRTGFLIFLGFVVRDEIAYSFFDFFCLAGVFYVYSVRKPLYFVFNSLEYTIACVYSLSSW